MKYLLPDNSIKEINNYSYDNVLRFIKKDYDTYYNSKNNLEDNNLIKFCDYVISKDSLHKINSIFNDTFKNDNTYLNIIKEILHSSLHSWLIFNKIDIIYDFACEPEPSTEFLSNFYAEKMIITEPIDEKQIDKYYYEFESPYEIIRYKIHNDNSPVKSSKNLYTICKAINDFEFKNQNLYTSNINNLLHYIYNETNWCCSKKELINYNVTLERRFE